MEENNWRKSYWRTNVKYVLILLIAWFLVSYVMGILLVEPLNKIRIGGFPVGFWMAQQGSMYAFVIIIVIYVKLINRLDKKYNLK
ncbi:MAG: DUF4212 domain-containing protein [Cyclobacteriaceae bacterium]